MVFLIVGILGNLSAQMTLFKGTFDEAIKKAREEKKDLFVDFCAEWCGPCKAMASEVFTQPEIGEYFNSRFVCVQVDVDAKVENITVGMQQRVEILKMLYRENEILIFDEPTAVLTPQEIDELMETMRGFAKEGKSILFITHKLNEIMAVSDRVTVLHKGKCIGTVNTKDVTKQQLSTMMVGRPVQLEIDKTQAHPTDVVMSVRNLSVPSRIHKSDAVKGVSFDVRKGEILCIAGIDGNGQTELIQGITGLEKSSGGTIHLCGQDISGVSIRKRNNK